MSSTLTSVCRQLSSRQKHAATQVLKKNYFLKGKKIRISITLGPHTVHGKKNK
jgi:hypothetical protein